MAELRRYAVGLDINRDREAAGAATPRAFADLRPPQTAAGRKHRERLEHIGLARAILAGERDKPYADVTARLRIGAKVRERQPPHARRADRCGRMGCHAALCHVLAPGASRAESRQDR